MDPYKHGYVWHSFTCTEDCIHTVQIFHRSLYMSIDIYQYALSVHSFYQVNVFLKNRVHLEAPSLQTCFVWTHPWIVVQSWSTKPEMFTLETQRRGYNLQRRSGHWWVLLHSSHWFRWRSKGHDESREYWAEYSCDRIDGGSTGQWGWQAANAIYHVGICRGFAATFQKGCSKRSVTAGRGV